MCLKIAFLGERLGANTTLEALDVTVNSWQMFFHVAFLRKLSAANLALVSGVRMFGSAAAALSMRRVVVSADRWLIAERHMTDLTLDTGSPCLKYTTRIAYRYDAATGKSSQYISSKDLQTSREKQLSKQG